VIVKPANGHQPTAKAQRPAKRAVRTTRKAPAAAAIA